MHTPLTQGARQRDAESVRTPRAEYYLPFEASSRVRARLRRLREERHVTHLGMDVNDFCDLEQGLSSISLSQLELLSQCLGVSIADLLRRDDTLPLLF